MFQVSLSKYHSAFVSSEGLVYTCGHGLGGRLGHGDELTYLVRAFIVFIVLLSNKADPFSFINF